MKINFKQLKLILGLCLFLTFLYFVQDSLLPVIISIILFYIINPLTMLLSKPRPKGLGLNKTLAIFLSALLLTIIATLVISFIAPPFINEFNRLAENLPNFISTTKTTLDKLSLWYQNADLPEQANAILVNSLQNITNYMVNFTRQSTARVAQLLSHFISLITIPIITFYLLKDRKKIFNGIIDLLPKSSQQQVSRMLAKINHLLTSYFKGVFILCLLVGFLCGLGLFLLGVNYFLILGLIAAITEFIPVIGPFIGAVPAIIVALIASPFLALKVILLYIIIQSLENSLLVPKIIGEKVNLHPVTVILAMLILSRLIGAWGLFFAAPIAGIIKILYTEIRQT